MKIIFVELDRCLACRNCEQVCSFQEAGGFKREDSNIWVQIDLEKRSIFTMTCLQCETALCLEVCPTEGLVRDPKTNAVVVDEAAHRSLTDAPGAEVAIDLHSCTVTLPDGATTEFEIEPFARYCLLEGMDPLGYLLSKDAEIRRYEEETAWTP